MSTTRLPARSVFLSLTTVLLMACSNDDSPTGSSGGGGNPEDTRASELTFGIGLPLLRDLFVGNYITMPRDDPRRTSRGCDAANICTSGTAIVCDQPGMLEITFTQCEIAQTTLDGTVSLVTQGSSGSGSVSLTIGGIVVAGEFSYTYESGCYGQGFQNFVISLGTETVTMNGGATWCDPYEMQGGIVIPDFANFEFVISGIDRLIDMALFSEPAGQLEVLVMNTSRTETYRICHGSLTGGSLSCAPGPDARIAPW